MRSKAELHSEAAEKTVRDIRRATRRQYSAEEKVRIVIAGLPEPSRHLPMHLQRQRHRFDRASRVVAHPVLNGLHHEYNLMARAA